MRTRGRGIVALVALAAGTLAVGCGGRAPSAQTAYGATAYRESMSDRPAREESFTVSADSRGGGGAATGYSMGGDEATVDFDVDGLLGQALGSEAPPPPQYAQASPEAEPPEPTATDATAQALLVYTARLTMAVHEVNENQERVIEIARALGGHLSVRTNETVEIRVPARSFEDAMRQIQELGDVTSRNVEVLDVSEEFRDLETRIHTLEVMRARVEQLLQQAQGVEAALAVEQHLERITVELERLRGRVRYLADRVAFSTITVRFGARTNQTAPTFRLPFSWLQSLGLDSLMSL